MRATNWIWPPCDDRWSDSNGKKLSIARKDTYFAAQLCRTIVNKSTDHGRQFCIYAANDAESKTATNTSINLDNSVVTHPTDMVLQPDEKHSKVGLSFGDFWSTSTEWLNWKTLAAKYNRFAMELLWYCGNWYHISKNQQADIQTVIVGTPRRIFGMVSLQLARCIMHARGLREASQVESSKGQIWILFPVKKLKDVFWDYSNVLGRIFGCCGTSPSRISSLERNMRK